MKLQGQAGQVHGATIPLLLQVSSEKTHTSQLKDQF